MPRVFGWCFLGISHLESGETTGEDYDFTSFFWAVDWATNWCLSLQVVRIMGRTKNFGRFSIVYILGDFRINLEVCTYFRYAISSLSF